MDLQPMTMPEEAAKAAFREYRGAFLAERNRIDGELMRGYKALSEGKQLIRLTETITAGGVDEMGRPRLAIARADETEIGFSRERNGAVTFAPDHARQWGRSEAADRAFAMPAGTLPPLADDAKFDYGYDSYATIPIIPPRLRPPHGLSGFQLLWEAIWHARRQTRAPRDPALLKHIGGDLYAVLAVWDLTDLERAVLEMRP